MWRGVLGRVLRSRDAALYARLFEAKAPAGVAGRYDDAPAPFALEAPMPDELSAMPGEGLDLWLKLFGDVPAEPVLDALAEAAALGLGKGRGRAELIEAVPMWVHGADDPLLPHVPRPPSVPDATRVTLTSPLRLRIGGGIMAAREFSADIWVRALLRRLRLLLALHGTGEGSGDPAGAITLREPQLWPVSMHRWSARQKREIDMSGVMGSFLLPLDGIEALWPALWLGQWTQVGSGTTAGLGAYRLKQI